MEKIYRMNYAGPNFGWYAIEIESLEDDFENLESFVSEGTPVLYCDDIEEVSKDLKIGMENITIVERESY